MKKITVLGSTGSIGTQTLSVIRGNPDFQVTALAAKNNIELLERQTREFHPSLVCVYDEDKAAELRARTSDLPVKIISGMDGLVSAAADTDASMVVTALVGMIGIRPTLAAIEARKDIALANKETLVCAGHLIMPLAEKCGVSIIPVDSEHSAIFQCLNGEDHNAVRKILLTASGGPFRGYSREQLKDVTPEEALRHPNWHMGRKVTVDSATLVNKGLETMEAKWLFGVEMKDIKVIIQPQSVIHSMVEFDDGAVMAQLALPDMKIPIQYALTCPERRKIKGISGPDFPAMGSLSFEEPDEETFTALKLARRAGERGGTLPTVFNAADECAVALFLDGRISFPAITQIIEETMDECRVIDDPSLDEILTAERQTEDFIESRWPCC